MEDEIIIKKEAKNFYDYKVKGSSNAQAIDDVHQIRYRLSDFYTDEAKAIFLDELEILIRDNLQKHRDQAHNGQPGVNCRFEDKPEKLLFYIRQEMAILPLIAHQKNETNPAQLRNKVFVSYSHADKDCLTDIQRHFKPFLNQIDFWDDTQIQPGQKWKEEIRLAIDSTKVAILLVSTDFLGSGFIASDELPPLLHAAEQNGAVILIIIVKPCLFEEFPTLNQYQTVNPPGRPVIKMDYIEKEELYVNLVRQTKRLLEPR